jgi:hypothetical protein
MKSAKAQAGLERPSTMPPRAGPSRAASSFGSKPAATGIGTATTVESSRRNRLLPNPATRRPIDGPLTTFWKPGFDRLVLTPQPLVVFSWCIRGRSPRTDRPEPGPRGLPPRCVASRRRTFRNCPAHRRLLPSTRASCLRSGFIAVPPHRHSAVALQRDDLITLRRCVDKPLWKFWDVAPMEIVALISTFGRMKKYSPSLQAAIDRCWPLYPPIYFISDCELVGIKNHLFFLISAGLNSFYPGS